MLGKDAADLTVGFEHTKRRAVSAQNHVDGALYPVAPQKAGGAKTSFVRKIVRDDRLPGIQRVAGGRIQVSANGRNPDDVILPANTGTDQKRALIGQVLEDLAERRFETDRYKTARLLQ